MGNVFKIIPRDSRKTGFGLFGLLIFTAFRRSRDALFYAGCNPDKAVEVAAIFREVMADVVANGLSEQEVERAKGQVRGSLVLGQEDTGSRMVRIGKSELVYGEIMSMDQVLAEVASVTREGLFAISKELLTQQPTLAVVGPYKRSYF